MLTQRQMSLLTIMVQSSDFHKVCDLAVRFGLTPRALRYDLTALQEFLSGHGVGLDWDKGRGARLLLPPERRALVEGWLKENQAVPYQLSRQERWRAILAALLTRTSRVSANQLADQMGVSRRTLVNDLKEVETWLADRRLALVRTAQGLTVEGPESAWRRALANLSSWENPSGQARFTPLASEGEMELIRRTVRHQALSLPFFLADTACEGLVFHIAVAIQRMRLHHAISLDPAKLIQIRESPEFQVADAICQSLQADLGVTFVPEERGFVALHLLSAKSLGRQVGYGAGGLDLPELEQPAAHFLRRVSSRLGCDLTGDAELMNGLLIHLRPLVYRLRYGLPVVNPLRQEIEERYGFLMETVSSSAAVLEDALGVTINQDEVAYLAMHVGAALERLSAPPHAMRVLLVCGSGMGTAQLLRSRLQRLFPDLQVVGVTPLTLLESALERTQPELVISTLDLPDLPGAVVVNPFLTDQDLMRIQQRLRQRVAEPVAERMRGPVLAELLDQSVIALDRPVQNWEEAIRAVGQLLVDAGKVEPGYVNAMVEMVHKAGPYIVIDKGVAMPHARPEQGVRSLGFSLLRLAEPICFGHPANDPVRLVICLASPDHATHLRALSQLANLLSEPEPRQVLEQGSLPEIMALIETTRAGRA